MPAHDLGILDRAHNCGQGRRPVLQYVARARSDHGDAEHLADQRSIPVSEELVGT